MSCELVRRHHHSMRLILAVLGAMPAIGGWTLAGCDSTGSGGGGTGGGMLRPSKQQWTIRCFESRAPNHQQIAGQLAETLARVPKLDRSRIRLESGTNGSVIFYGTYTKTSSRDGEWQFDDRFKDDIEIIRKVTVDQVTPFLFAVPELVDKGQPADKVPWSVEQATGPYTLQIATFYDTPTFTGRVQAANQYVAGLRDEGFEAYVYHGDLESVVFVGNFNDGDIIQSEQGPQLGPRVQMLIAKKPEEFQYVTENGYRRKILGPSGVMEPIPSFLVEVPDKATLKQAR